MFAGLHCFRTDYRAKTEHHLFDDRPAPYLPIDAIPEMLRKAGYQSAGFGKTHWGRATDKISTRGFEVRYVGTREVGLEQGAYYQDDDDMEGLLAYRQETKNYGSGEQSVEGYIGTTS